MKENKKKLLDKISKLLKKNSGFESKVLTLALQKLDEGDYVLEGHFVYTANLKRLVYVLGDKTSLAIPDGVEEIGDRAVMGKKSLTALTLPKTLKKIGRDAFSDCDALGSVVVPASVEHIEPYAFSDCDSLKSVYFEDVPKELSRKAFAECENLQVFSVPADGVKAIRKALHVNEDDLELMVDGREGEPKPAAPAKKEAPEPAKKEAAAPAKKAK